MVIKKGFCILLILLIVCISLCSAVEIKSISKKVAEPADNSLVRTQNTCADLAKPEISYLSSEPYTTDNGDKGTRYWFSIDNWADYPSSLFTGAPDLPPCGLNTNASRTWVSIYDQDNKYLYGYCSLGKPEHLGKLWYAILAGETAPVQIYVVIEDRRCQKTSQSGNLDIPPDGGQTTTGGSDGTTPKDRGKTLDLLSPDKIKDTGGVGLRQSGNLPAPVQISPEEGAVIDNKQRKIVCTWEPVEGAASYTLQIDCYHCCLANKWCTDVNKEYRLYEGIETTDSWSLLGGMNDGRWRVWAVSSLGSPGVKSPWRAFTCAL